MTKHELLNILKTKKPKKIWAHFIRTHNLQHEIDNVKLYQRESVQEIKYRLSNNIQEIPECLNTKCHNRTKFSINKNKYQQFCSNKCRMGIKSNDPVVILKNRPHGVKYDEFLKYHNLRQFIDNAKNTPNESDKETIYRLLNNIDTAQCSCGNKLVFNEFTNEYNKTCSYVCHGKMSVEMNKVKNLQKYGVEYIVQKEEIKQKSRETCLKKYGVPNFSQSPLSTNGYRWKSYVLPSGKIIKIQGYENFLLDELLKIYPESEIKTNRSDMPEFWYTLNDKKHRYFPDVFIPSTSTIFEVKSKWTIKCDVEMNKSKFQSVKNAGYNFVLKIY